MSSAGYKIGAVSKITGIGTETLRAWERRYQTVSPNRSASGSREYTRTDVEKLLMLKSLVDDGHAISSVANLSMDELKHLNKELVDQGAQIEKYSELKDQRGDDTDKQCRVGLIGDGFPLRVTDGLEDFEGIKLIGVTGSLSDWVKDYDQHEPHIIIVETPTINKETHAFVQRVLQVTRAWHIIVLFGFSSQEAMAKLQNSQVTAIRHSVDIYELARLCLSRVGSNNRTLRMHANTTLPIELSIPARRFSDRQMQQLASESNSIKCECPHHLVEIIKSLTAFEIYSAECQNAGPDDAELHAYLHGTTAQVRSIMEDALAHIVKYEDMQLNDVSNVLPS